MRTFTRFLTLALLTAVVAGAQEKFSQRLTAAERQAAGLDQLSAEQLAALDALVEREQHSAPVAKSPGTKSAAPMATAAAPAATPLAEKKRLFGLPMKEEDGASITGTLVGEFRGWTGTTTFRLEDGQVWVQEDASDVRAMKPQQSPRVKIVRSMFGGYKLTVEGDPMWVRVKRLQ